MRPVPSCTPVTTTLWKIISTIQKHSGLHSKCQASLDGLHRLWEKVGKEGGWVGCIVFIKDAMTEPRAEWGPLKCIQGEHCTAETCPKYGLCFYWPWKDSWLFWGFSVCKMGMMGIWSQGLLQSPVGCPWGANVVQWPQGHLPGLNEPDRLNRADDRWV